MNAEPNRRPAPNVLFRLLRPLASLQLTVTLFAFSMGLVFFGTLAQQTTGLWDAVYQYFWSWVVFIDAAPTVEFGKIFFSFLGIDKAYKAPSWLVLPWPGGKLIGGLMFANLIAAHLVRFKFTWKRAGIITSHAGLLLLFVGEYICREFQVEQRMTIREGETVNYTSDHNRCELAFTSRAADGSQHVVVVPEAKLRRALRTGEPISHDELPCDVSVSAYYTNSRVLDGEAPKPGTAPPVPATAGLGLERVAVREPDVTGVDMNKENTPSAYVTFHDKGGKPLGTYLLSRWFAIDNFNPEQRETQALAVGATSYDIELRPARYYKPFSLMLKPDGFRFDRYIGTGMARNFSSDLLVIDPERDVERPVTVRMNSPLRHRGETFYQSSYDSRTERATVLQVVRNPGWLIPYIACGMVTAGLLFHFVLALATFLRRQTALAARAPAASAVPPVAPRRVWVPVLAVAVAVLFLGSKMRPASNPGKLDLSAVSRVPVVDGGRVKPLDTVARVYLRKISGREEYVGADGETYPAIKWLMDALATPFQSDGVDGPASDHRVIRIDNDQVLALLELPRREGSRYSLKEVGPKAPLLMAASERYEEIKAGKSDDAPSARDRIDRLFESGARDVFGGQVTEVAQRVNVYVSLCQRRVPLLLPPDGEREWSALGAAESGALYAARVKVMVFQKQAADTAAAEQLLRSQRAELQSGRTTRERRRELEESARAVDRLAVLLAAEYLEESAPVVAAVGLLSAYRSQDQARFDAAVKAFRELSANVVTASEASRSDFELFLNTFAPAYHIMHLYALALFVTFLGWAVVAVNPAVGDQFRRFAFWLTVVAFVTHGFALVSRMYVSDRWFVFVTNLYSSAVFIGWAAVGIGLLLERTYKLGLGNALAAALGGATAIIAHGLAASGDTLEMMQAVLDTNFWLAIHVTTVTFGYSATYAAGLVAILYLILGLFTPLFRTKETTFTVTAYGAAIRGTDLSKVLGNVIYGIVCLATLFSFFGTVSGGIWADQSWGRFWGWDPKENGAVLIVIWNALILHARWCGLVRDRGTAVLALVGNMVTTWSWFGTNQLGVGLHAYGFSKTLAAGCTVTWVLHAGLIAAGCMPKRWWMGYAEPTGKKV